MFAGSALAAPSWLQPKSLSEPGFGAFNPDVGVDDSGEVVTSWFGATSTTGELAQVAVRPRGGAWTQAQTISPLVGGAVNPDLAVSASGTAVAVWEFDSEEGSPLGSFIEAGVRTGGSWSVAPLPKDDPNNPLQFSYFPRVAVDPAGDALAVWQECYSADKHKCFHNEGEYAIRATARGADGGWSPLMEVTTGQSENAKKISPAIDENGDLAVAWEDMKGHEAHVALLRAGDSAWRDHVLAAPGAIVSGSPQVDFAGDGTATAVWDEEDLSGFWIAGATAAPGSSTWSSSQHISSTGFNAFQPELAVAPNGDAVAIWETLTGGRQVQAAIRAGGSWQAAQDLSAEGIEAEHPHVAINASGATVAAWKATGASGTIVQGNSRPTGGGWGGPQTISAAGVGAIDPAVAIDSEGNGIVVWRAATGGELIQAAALDAAGPRLDGISIPATATVGQTLSFGVAPSDAWSALGGTSWSFGDGGSGGGTNVSHAFSQPGTYQVTVTASDALGNARSATGTVVVSGSASDTKPPATETTQPSKPKKTGTDNPKLGSATAAALAPVRNGKALVTLHCGGGAPCSGLARLAYRRGSVIGKARFSIAAGGSRTLRIALGPAAMELLSADSDQQLTVRLEGPGVKVRKLVLVL